MLGVLALIGGIAALGEWAGGGDRIVDPGPITDNCPLPACQPALAPAAADGRPED